MQQTMTTLEELNNYLQVASHKTISSSTYGAGRGLILPPPSLNMLLATSENWAGDSAHKSGDESQARTFQLHVAPTAPGRSLFAELMARSEARLRAENGDGEQSLELRSSSVGMIEILCQHWQTDFVLFLFLGYLVRKKQCCLRLPEQLLLSAEFFHHWIQVGRGSL